MAPWLQEDQQEGDQNHHKGVELSQPCHNDGGKAAAARRLRGDGVADAGDLNEACQAADSTGNCHGADGDFLDVDAGITAVFSESPTTEIS